VLARHYFSLTRISQTHKSGRRREHDPHYLDLFRRYHGTADLHQQFATYTELAERTLAPVGDALGVVLEGDDWAPGDLARAAHFWQTLFT
jgi:hypothetical protein